MAAAIQPMLPRCSSMPPEKLESLHVCQRTSFRQFQTLLLSRRAIQVTHARRLFSGFSEAAQAACLLR